MVTVGESGVLGSTTVIVEIMFPAFSTGTYVLNNDAVACISSTVTFICPAFNALNPNFKIS